MFMVFVYLQIHVFSPWRQTNPTRTFPGFYSKIPKAETHGTKDRKERKQKLQKFPKIHIPKTRTTPSPEKFPRRYLCSLQKKKFRKCFILCMCVCVCQFHDVPTNLLLQHIVNLWCANEEGCVWCMERMQLYIYQHNSRVYQYIFNNMFPQGAKTMYFG